MTSGGNNFNNFRENQLTSGSMATLGMMYHVRGVWFGVRWGVWSEVRGVYTPLGEVCITHCCCFFSPPCRELRWAIHHVSINEVISNLDKNTVYLLRFVLTLSLRAITSSCANHYGPPALWSIGLNRSVLVPANQSKPDIVAAGKRAQILLCGANASLLRDVKTTRNWWFTACHVSR